jgi:hypothetical protein
MFDSQDNGNRRYHDEPLYTEKIFADRKIFFVDLKSNDRGKFLKITEDVRGRRDTIMVPAETLDEFIDALQNVADFLAKEDGGARDDDDDDDDDFEDDDEEEAEDDE